MIDDEQSIEIELICDVEYETRLLITGLNVQLVQENDMFYLSIIYKDVTIYE